MDKCLHGEVILVECKIPKEAKRIEIKSNFHVIGESETSGNDHRIAVKEGVELYELNGTLYIKNTVKTDVFCPNKERHDTKVLPESEWEIKKANDFDFLSDEERVVID